MIIAMQHNPPPPPLLSLSLSLHTLQKHMQTLIVLLHKFFTILFRSCILLYLFTYLKVGVGMSMEGIEQNPVVYDLMSEMAFQHNKADVEVMLRFEIGRAHV